VLDAGCQRRGKPITLRSKPVPSTSTPSSAGKKNLILPQCGTGQLGISCPASALLSPHCPRTDRRNSTPHDRQSRRWRTYPRIRPAIPESATSKNLGRTIPDLNRAPFSKFFPPSHAHSPSALTSASPGPGPNEARLEAHRLQQKRPGRAPSRSKPGDRKWGQGMQAELPMLSAKSSTLIGRTFARTSHLEDAPTPIPGVARPTPKSLDPAPPRRAAGLQMLVAAAGHHRGGQRMEWTDTVKKVR